MSARAGAETAAQLGLRQPLILRAILRAADTGAALAGGRKRRTAGALSLFAADGGDKADDDTTVAGLPRLSQLALVARVWHLEAERHAWRLLELRFEAGTDGTLVKPTCLPRLHGPSSPARYVQSLTLSCRLADDIIGLAPETGLPLFVCGGSG
jgi:hypothetical protein